MEKFSLHYGRKSVKDVSFEVRAATSMQHFSCSYSHSQQAREYLHFFRSLSTVVPRLHRVHASYLKWSDLLVDTKAY